MRPRRSTILFLLMLASVAFVGGALAQVVSAPGAQRLTNDAGSPEKQTRAVQSEVGRLATGLAEHQKDPLQSGMVSRVTGPQATLESATAQGATITLQPVNPPGSIPPYPSDVSINGQTITLGSLPAQVWFEIQITGAPQNLRTFQTAINGAGFSGANATCAGLPANGFDLHPAIIPCTSDTDCRAQASGIPGSCPVDEPSRCRLFSGNPYIPDGHYCEPGFQNQCDPYWAFHGITQHSFAAMNIYRVNYIYAGTTEPGFVATEFNPTYVGTLVLDVPAHARGSYTIDFDQGADTFLQDDQQPAVNIPIAAFIPAVIETPCSPCQDSTDCPDDGLFCNGSESCNLVTGLCAHSGSPCQPNQVCDENTHCLDFGACCLEMGTACVDTNAPDCVNPPPNGAGGVFIGAGSTCPTQNVAIIPEGGGTVFVHVVGPPVACPPHLLARAPAGCPPAGPYTDPWVSKESAAMCHNFGSPDTNPIPADFFDPGSDPFLSTVCLRGVPLGMSQYGDADTLISRSADPFDRCDLPSATPSTVNIEVVALSLESVNPITVTHSGGQSPETWNVTVDLSPGGLPPGTPPRTLTATKSHCNGGTFTSVLYVQPRFTFTKVSNPSEVRVLDTRIVGTPPVELMQSDPHPWVSDLDPYLGAMVDPCSAFHANIADSYQLLDCDCNTNSRRDLCDVEEGVSLDCNANRVPDSCDVASATSQDANLNGVPDECEAPLSAVADPSGINKARIVSFVIPSAATAATGETAIQIKLVSLMHPDPPNLSQFHAPDFSGFQNQVRWVGPPSDCTESDVAHTTFKCAILQCTPHYMDWVAALAGQTLHVTGAESVPSSAYDVRQLALLCQGHEATCPAIAAPLRIDTARWGDVVAPFQQPAPAALTQPNISDVAAIVDKFKEVPTAIAVARADLNPGVPDYMVNIADVASDVDAFENLAYPFAGPTNCP